MSPRRYDHDRLAGLAEQHLWPHFTPLSAYRASEHPLPVIVRGEGCYVWDAQGNRYLDGLAALFCVNAGHGRPELVEAARAQMQELAYSTIWYQGHPAAIELAAKLAELSGMERIFFTSGGSEAVESAIKLARAWHRLNGESTRTKLIARQGAYHGTSMGALSATGITGIRQPFEPLLPGFCHVPNTNFYRAPEGYDPLAPADAIEQRILFEGPETVAAVILEPVQNSGGCFTAPEGYFQRVREICDRYGVLLISDEVICGFGRLGHWFGFQRYGYEPDLVTTAKGLTSAYVPMGALLASKRISDPFRNEGAAFAHGFTFGGHPVAAAVALANIELLERERLLEHVLETEPLFESILRGLGEQFEVVGDVRGQGFFWALELVRERETKLGFERAEAHQLLRGFVSPALDRAGLICRADDRDKPVIQLAPPLIAGEQELAGADRSLRIVLAALQQQLKA